MVGARPVEPPRELPVHPDSAMARPRRGRAGKWLRRYAPAEAAATIGALLAASVADTFGVAAATVLAGAIGEGIAFYTVIFVRDLPDRATRRPGVRGTLATLPGLLLEFGPAELLDTLLVRPLAMYLAVALVGHMMLGIVLGKIVADVVFYTVAIIGYEFGRSIALASPVVAVSERGTVPAMSPVSPPVPSPPVPSSPVPSSPVPSSPVPSSPVPSSPVVSSPVVSMTVAGWADTSRRADDPLAAEAVGRLPAGRTRPFVGGSPPTAWGS